MNGKPNTLGNYKNGDKIGKWQYFNEQGQILRLENYKYGHPHGKWLTYYPIGAIESETNYENGVKEGNMKYLEPNGKIIFEALFQRNKMIKIVSGTKPEEKDSPKPKRDYGND